MNQTTLHNFEHETDESGSLSAGALIELTADFDSSMAFGRRKMVVTHDEVSVHESDGTQAFRETE